MSPTPSLRATNHLSGGENINEHAPSSVIASARKGAWRSINLQNRTAVGIYGLLRSARNDGVWDQVH
jgi:hypothetical protein